MLSLRWGERYRYRYRHRTTDWDASLTAFLEVQRSWARGIIAGHQVWGIVLKPFKSLSFGILQQWLFFPSLAFVIVR
jgi:hypothetical protein